MLKKRSNINLSIIKEITMTVVFRALPIAFVFMLLGYMFIARVLPHSSPSLYLIITFIILVNTVTLILIIYGNISKFVYKLIKQVDTIPTNKYINLNTSTKSIIALVQNMSEYLKKEKEYIEELRISNIKLQQANEIIEKSSIVVFEWSVVPGVPVKFVTNNISIFGYTVEDFVSGDVDYWDIIYPDDVEKTQNIIWGNREKDISEYKHTYRVVCKNGDVRWVEEWTLQEKDCHGNLVSEKGIIRDITEQVAAEERVKHLSYHDKLTGLYNRAYFEDSLIKLNKIDLHPISVIIGDMNGLKLTNDAFGHKAGDNLLIVTGKIIESVCPRDAIISRFGGDEFAVILTNTNSQQTMEICNNIRKLCLECNSGPIQPNIALGYATKNDISEAISDVIREADDNMYRNKLNESKSIRSSIISSLKTTLEEKTIETTEHAERLKEMSITLGRALALSDSMLDELAIASVMHDIGKIAIPDSILMNPSKLTEEEWATMKKHPEIGYHIMLSSPKMASIAEYILAHHERWDGAGYPQKLKGQDIPIISRIIAIADAYDVMTHDRVYCKAKSKEEAVAEILKCSGTQFDPAVVKAFLDII